MMKNVKSLAVLTAACLLCISGGFIAGSQKNHNSLISAAEGVVRGDVDGDGSVTVKDFVVLRSILLGTYEEPQDGISVKTYRINDTADHYEGVMNINSSAELNTYLYELNISSAEDKDRIMADLSDVFTDNIVWILTDDVNDRDVSLSNVTYNDDEINCTYNSRLVYGTGRCLAFSVLIVPRSIYNSQPVHFNDFRPVTETPVTPKITTIPAKPVIYLYPEHETDINVKVKTDESTELTYTYPDYPEDAGWNMRVEPDSTMYDENGREYSYLFWEARSTQKWDMSEGFVVKGEDTVEFLQEKLAYLGLTPKEYNDFIVYWLPKMQDNPYNLISFQTDAYEECAQLEITPKPDCMQRVFMAFKGLDEYEEVKEQKLEPFERHGYSVIEWGGAEITEASVR